MNQPVIVAALRRIGAQVTSLHRTGDGIPDLLVSFRGRWALIEVKVGDEQPNALQQEWAAKQQAPVLIVRTPEEAVAALLGEKAMA